MGWTSNQVKTTSFFLWLPAPSPNLPCLKSSCWSLEVKLKFPGSSWVSSWEYLGERRESQASEQWLNHPGCSLQWEAIPTTMTECLEAPIALLSLIWSFICVEFARRMLVMNEISIRSHNCPPKLLFHLFWKCVKFYNTMHSFEKSCKWEIAVFQLWRWMEQMKGAVVYWSIMPVACILSPMKQFLDFVLNANCLCELCVLTQRALLIPVAFPISATHKHSSQTYVVYKSKAKGVLILLNW